MWEVRRSNHGVAKGGEKDFHSLKRTIPEIRFITENKILR